MLSSLKYFFKRFWVVILIALIINVPLIVMGTTRTNSYLTLKGDTMKFNSVLDIETDYKEEGSFSTIYVISFNHSTILQNILVENDLTIAKGELSTSTTTGSNHITDKESYDAGKIQYYSSINESIIMAYNKAISTGNNVSIDYYFDGYYVTWYNQTSLFRVGDHIIKVYPHIYNGEEISYTDEERFRNALNTRYVNDRYVVERNGVEYEFVLTVDNNFYGYSKYEINMDTISPKVRFKDNAIGGPSGGLLQALSIYNRITEADLTHGLKISGTGTISYNGEVGAIGGIAQKVPTAVDDNIDIFFCPKDNYEEAKKVYDSINHKNMKLIMVETFEDAVDYLEAL